MTRLNAPRRPLSWGFLAALIALPLVIVPAPAAHADTIVCSDDACDEGAWAAARGADNEMSYWGMSPGHNCTNYVAWKLIEDGVERPETNPGDAATWAARAEDDGYLVDDRPEVGAVAQWEALAGGNGPDGHVAYVEQLNEDGTIVVSEDYWHGGAQTGPLTFRTVDPATVSHFIHYLDTSGRLRTATASDTGWASAGAGLDPAPAAMSAVAMDGTSLVLYYSENGALMEATPGATGWQAVDTGVDSASTSMGAVDMGNGQPYVMTLEDQALVMSVRTPSGWQRMPTGVRITGEVAAVNLGGLWPTVFLSEGGALYRIWGDNVGWHAERTGVEIWGPISAALDPAGWPEVYSVESGMLFRAFLDQDGWHKELTGVTASGRTAAVSTATGVQVFLLQDDAVFRIQRDGSTWTKEPTGLDGGQLVTAADLGGASPIVLQVG